MTSAFPVHKPPARPRADAPALHPSGRRLQPDRLPRLIEEAKLEALSGSHRLAIGLAKLRDPADREQVDRLSWDGSLDDR
jgi:hypothetical protein